MIFQSSKKENLGQNLSGEKFVLVSFVARRLNLYWEFSSIDAGQIIDDCSLQLCTVYRIVKQMLQGYINIDS